MDYYSNINGALLSEPDEDEHFEPPIDIIKVKCGCGHEFETINEGEFTDSTCGKCRIERRKTELGFDPIF